jgi:hypothetical protein
VIKIFRFALMICVFLVSYLGGQEIGIVTEEGVFSFDVAGDTTLKELSLLTEELGGEKCGGYLLLKTKSPEEYKTRVRGGPLTKPRDYYALLTTQEKGHLSFIVTNLANKSLIALAGMRHDLEDAGDSIEHIHPIRFLHTVFTDEELKVAIKNIRSRGWVWENFMGGLRTSLQSEHSLGNVLETHIFDLAHAVKIQPHLIVPAAKNQEWDKFVSLLIRYVSRQGGSDRYD